MVLIALAWLFLQEWLNLATWFTANVMSGLVFVDKKYKSFPELIHLLSIRINPKTCLQNRGVVGVAVLKSCCLDDLLD
jgi:hypothetical protein